MGEITKIYKVSLLAVATLAFACFVLNIALGWTALLFLVGFGICLHRLVEFMMRDTV